MSFLDANQKIWIQNQICFVKYLQKATFWRFLFVCIPIRTYRRVSIMIFYEIIGAHQEMIEGTWGISIWDRLDKKLYQMRRCMMTFCTKPQIFELPIIQSTRHFSTWIISTPIGLVNILSERWYCLFLHWSRMMRNRSEKDRGQFAPFIIRSHLWSGASD